MRVVFKFKVFIHYCPTKIIKVGSENSFFLFSCLTTDRDFQKIIEPINDFFKIEGKL